VGFEMIVHELPLAGAAEIESPPHRDHRGWFTRWFCQRELEQLNDGRSIQQINSSFTRRAGAVRGLHFQYPPAMEDKLVRCIAGRVFDVMVDLRKDSPTRGKWHALVLDAEEQKMVYIPRGFAHGFQTLVDGCQILYLHTEFHAPDREGGFRYDSPCLGIEWPIPVTELSDRDRNLPPLSADFAGIDA
jgi:dTDP-4-dehydrorhamnose 3,5-epimerase